MNQHIQTLKRFNAWLAGEDVIDLPAPSAVIEAINQTPRTRRRDRIAPRSIRHCKKGLAQLA